MFSAGYASDSYCLLNAWGRDKIKGVGEVHISYSQIYNLYILKYEYIVNPKKIRTLYQQWKKPSVLVNTMSPWYNVQQECTIER